MNKYCTCGHATFYASAAPKFCSGCGQSFDLNISKPTIKTSRANNLPIFLNRNEEEQVIPHLEKIELVEQVRRGAPLKRETIGSIWNSEPIQINRGNPEPKKMSNKKILEQFKVDATPRSRNNPIEIGG